MITKSETPTIDCNMDEMTRLLERLKAAGIDEKDYELVKALIQSYDYVTNLIRDKETSIRRLRKILFGSTSEKTREVLGDLLDGEGPSVSEGTEIATRTDDVPGNQDESQVAPEKEKPKGHGRNGADAYPGAKRIKVRHESLKPGDRCTEAGCKGRLSRLKKPARLLRFKGGAPIQGEIFEKERLRCNLCGKIYTAKSPEGVGEEKYNATAVSMMAILRYGIGLPLNRLDNLQENLGIPLPASNQWDVVRQASDLFIPVYEELIRQAAQGKVLHNDDTDMTILEFMKQDQERRKRGDPPERTGMFTSGIVSVKEEIRIAIFFTGREHAGENLGKVLAKRAVELSRPIQMCDALSRNVSEEFNTIVSNCMSHARRTYVNVVEDFPEECRFVLETLGAVFKNDATARKEGMTDDERLEFHRRESKRLMAKLRLWMWRQLKEHLVEPNSGLGKAIFYMRKHWRKLTRFLFIPGAPLENNLCERLLKQAIIHRKNSLFYKTQNGARVGDLYMSLIATCQLSKVNPFDYLNEIQRNASEVAKNPAEWMPWNYRAALDRSADDG